MGLKKQHTFFITIILLLSTLPGLGQGVGVSVNESERDSVDDGFKIMPLVDAGYWNELEEGDNLVHLGLGAEAFYVPHPKFTLHLRAVGNYSQYPAFLEKRIDSTGFIPHHGKYTSKVGEGYLFPDIQGSVLWKINETFSLEAGKERQFLGEGHRSVLFSGNANSFPYIRGSLQFWNLKYFHQVGFLRDINNQTASFHVERKNLAMHYLSWNISESFNLGVFETIIWRNADSTYTRGIDPNFINPVIFFRPVEFSHGSGDNALIGLAGSYQPHSGLTIYSQLMIDELSLQHSSKANGWKGNKFGFQAGIKMKHPLGLEGFDFLAEFNQARPFTYSHSNPIQNFGSHLEPLAHPLGANFREILTKMIYQHDDFYFRAKWIRAWKGENPPGENLGGDIYETYLVGENAYGHEMLQGIRSRLSYVDLRVGYTLVPEWGLALEGRVLGRSYRNVRKKQQNLYLQVGISSNLYQTEKFFY